MKPTIKVLTLGVNDLEKSLAFYREGLGFASKGIVGTELEHGAVALFEMNGGDLILSLFQRENLAKDASIPVAAPSATEFSIGHFVGSKASVDAVMARASNAGARVTDPARDRFWGGYSGYFQDPDGHLWEVAWNPDLGIED